MCRAARRALWEALWQAGQPLGVAPYGTEAMHVLRAEKGYIIVGQDTDGTVTPLDAGHGLGDRPRQARLRRQARRWRAPTSSAPGRKQLVGLLTEDPEVVLTEGAQIVADPDQPIPMRMIGHVTSAYWSATLGRSIALALVEGGHDRMGETLFIPDGARAHRARVTGVTFYDPEGARLKL
ncbi:MAG: hypothetical protein KatS3mg118_1971 [Paracoccaceae bacterium]|nr:MAG: hypothetical protein KatS3mg118_1971 [Paracoccaceae bacterium]